jgi:hypothetical protein
MIHVVQRFHCVRASVTTVAMVGWATSLAVLIKSSIGRPHVSFLRGCSKKFLLVFWWPVAIRVNDVYWFGVALLIFIVARSQSFVGL